MQRHTVAQFKPCLPDWYNECQSLETVAHTGICQSATLSGRDSSTNGGFPTRLQMFLLSGRRDVAAFPGATVTYFLLQITTSCIFLRFQMVLLFLRTARKQIHLCNFRADKLFHVLFRFFSHFAK